MSEHIPSTEQNMHSDEWWQAELNRCVAVQQDKYRELFAECSRIRAERDKYQKALEDICERGRNPTAEKALGK